MSCPAYRRWIKFVDHRLLLLLSVVVVAVFFLNLERCDHLALGLFEVYDLVL